MKVVGLYLVRNEVDLIEVNLRHHFATAIDEAIVIDNGSSDGTLEKVAALAEVLPIRLASEPGPYDQSARVTRMARLAVSGGADWVLPIDADEFWVGTDTTLKAVLDETPADVSALRAEIVNFVQRRDVLIVGTANLLSMTMRPRHQVGPIELCEELVEMQQIGFVEMMYPPKWVSRAQPSMVITNGNHSVEGIPDTTVMTDRIVCLHAPLRARSLLTGKLDQGRRVIEDEGRKDYWHVRRWWRLSREGTIEADWAANSYENGSLTVGGQLRELVEDTRLRDVVADLVPATTPDAVDPRDCLSPSIAAYLLALDTVPGRLSPLDLRLYVEIDRLQREHALPGHFLEMSPHSVKSAILLEHLARLSHTELLVVRRDESPLSADAGTATAAGRADQGYEPTFVSQFLRFHDRLPEMLDQSTLVVDGDAVAHRYRIIHVDTDRPHNMVHRDIGSTQRSLTPGGIVVIDTSPDVPIESLLAKVGGELRRFVPLFQTDAKLYGTWDDATFDWGTGIDDWVARNSDIAGGIEDLCGRRVKRLSSSQGGALLTGLSTIPPLDHLASAASPDHGLGAGGDSTVYRSARESARSSAQYVVPLLLELTAAQSVVDVGCGTGTWLSVFRQCGIGDVHGLDGGHIESSTLAIPVEAFEHWDLESPLPITRRFDLALCLEVAEHLSGARADALVDDLVRLAPIVCFSAAVPLQGGAGHLNEQWPSYWAQKFAEKGLLVVDAVRPSVWDNEDVAMGYTQNCLLFATPESLHQHEGLATAHRSTNPRQLDLIHPSLFLRHRLGIEGPASGVPVHAANGWTASEARPVPDPPAPEAPPLGLRVILNQLPAAVGRALRPRWVRLRSDGWRHLRSWGSGSGP